jgi:hypothetical protein
MPRYDAVPDDEQLSGSGRRSAEPQQAEPASPPPIPDPWVAITTTVPTSVRREVSVACAVHGVKLKDVVTEALREWLRTHPTGL